MKLLLFVLLIVSAGPNSQSQTEFSEKTPPVVVTRIPYYPQFYLYVFYAKGVANPLNNSDVHLLKIKDWNFQRLNQCDHQIRVCSAEIPSAMISSEQGPQTAYDFLVLVVSSGPNLAWINSDGTPAHYPEAKMPLGANQDRYAVRVISRSKIHKYLRATNKAEFHYDFTSGQ